MEPLDLWVQLVNVGPQEEWVPLDSPDATVPSVEPDQQERRENRERKVRSDPQDKMEIRDPWGLWDYLGLLDHRGRMEIRERLGDQARKEARGTKARGVPQERDRKSVV